MANEPHESIDRDSPPIEDRTDTGRGFWSVGWPLLALALIAVMAMHTCVAAP